MAETQKAVSAGIQELIEKLENDGVKKGQTKANSIIEEAKTTAEKILKDAKDEASRIKDAAKKEATGFKSASEEELKIAFRDSMLVLRKEIEKTFTKQVGKMITQSLEDKKMLGQVILEIARSAKDKANISSAKNVEVILPAKVFSLDDFRKDGKELKEGALTKLAVDVAKDILQEGITFKTSDKISTGIKVYIKDTQVEIDLSDKAVAEILLEHLQPRFRAVLEGEKF